MAIMRIESKVKKSSLIEWRLIKDLQPEDLKIKKNNDSIKKSIIANGIAKAYDVWQDDNGVVYFLDGHTRRSIFEELELEGHDLPKKVMANFIDCRDRNEAIKILLEVHNQKQNRMDGSVLHEWITEESVELTLEVETLHVLLDKGGDEEEEKELKKYWVPDCLFASDNDYDIPTLFSAVNPINLELPFMKYGVQARTKSNPGTYHFYTDDYKFDAIWDDPMKIVNSGIRCLVEPNITMHQNMPISYGIFLIYKKRWLSRYMQDFGINIILDLNVCEKFAAYNMLGIPKGYNAFMTRGYDNRINNLEDELKIAQTISGKETPNLMVLGSSKKVKAWCQERNVLYLDNSKLDV